MEWLSSLWKVFELKQRFLFAVAAIGYFFLFSPQPVLDGLSLSEPVALYRPWIGGGTVVFTVLWIIQLWPLLTAWLDRRKSRNAALSALDGLSVEERLLLAYCITQKQRTLTLELTHRIGSMLRSKGLLKLAPGQYAITEWPHSVPDVVWDALIKDPQLVTYQLDLSSQNWLNYVNETERHLKRYDWRI